MNEQKIQPGRIMLNMQMIADDLEDAQLNFKINSLNKEPKYVGFSLYNGQKEFAQNIVYLLSKGNSAGFPVDNYSFITSEDISGKAPHIACLDLDDTSIINYVSSIFERYHQFEAKINSILFSEGTLTDICREGSLFFRNPMYIHDKYFTVLALPSHPEGMLKFEKSKENGSLHIPLWLINEFKFDDAYQDTFTKKNASIWGLDQYPKTMRSLYVNLYDGSYYFGRLLVNELESSIKPGQFQLAEILAEYIKIIIKRDRFSKNRHYRDYEDTIRTIIRDGKIDNSDIKEFLEIQGWKEDDIFVCVKLQSQNPEILIKSDGALRSKLPSVITESFDFFHEQKLCLIINISKSNVSVSDSSIKTALAGLVRESLMYCGISNATRGILNIGPAFNQADFVLSHIKANSSQWLMSFNECALSFMIAQLKKNSSTINFVTPELKKLKEIDMEKGTDYFHTLRIYLKNERNIPKASDELIIHRTTLQYRLEKIKELTKLDLDQENVRLYLLMSYFILAEDGK